MSPSPVLSPSPVHRWRRRRDRIHPQEGRHHDAPRADEPRPATLPLDRQSELAALIPNALSAIIQRSTEGFTWSNIEQSATDSNYDDNGLLSGTRYYYRVFLENDLIESAPSYVEYVDVP